MYTHDEILEELKKPEWNDPDDIIETTTTTTKKVADIGDMKR